jgi:hypothetical protein
VSPFRFSLSPFPKQQKIKRKRRDTRDGAKKGMIPPSHPRQTKNIFRRPFSGIIYYAQIFKKITKKTQREAIERYNIAKRIDENKIRRKRGAWGVRESRRQRAHLNRNKHRRVYTVLFSSSRVLSEEFGYLFIFFLKKGKSRHRER